VFDPANENPVIGRLDIEEFHAHTDTRLNNTDDPEGFDGLLFVAEGDAHAGFHRQGFASADETASHRDISGDTDGASAGFKVKKLGVRCKGVANGVAAVADTQGSAGTLRSSIVHGDDIAHSSATHTKRHTRYGRRFSSCFSMPENSLQESNGEAWYRERGNSAAARADCSSGHCALLVGTTRRKPAGARDEAARATLVLQSAARRRRVMRPEGLRQSDRVSFRMPVEASWYDSGGVAVKQTAQTLLISRNGAVLRLPEKLSTGQAITLRRQQEGDTWKTTRARILAEIDREPDGFLYAIVILEPRSDFWDVDFPAPQKAEEALARLLMECSFCRRREVAYLNELELKSFEARKCVARICKICDAPSIWIEAQSEIPDPESSPPKKAVEPPMYPRRNRARVKARVLACIRRRGFQEEVAVCEDLSKGGISFRSRNQYPEGSRLEVAVPFTPGAGAIFVPIRIVFSQAIPSAGLFRHGAAYIKPPVDGAD
jgi:hypothetical protein